MNTDNVNQPLLEYLESMHTLPPINLQAISVLTLSELRKRSAKRLGIKITQTHLAKALGRGRSTIQEWEGGVSLKGIQAEELSVIAKLFDCRLEEVIAAIANTRLLTKEENN